MDRGESRRSAKVYDLEAHRARRAARALIVIEPDGTWHPASLAATIARHPSRPRARPHHDTA